MANSVTRSVAVCALWLSAIAAGGFVFLRYENTQGVAGHVPQQWPAGAAVPLDPRLDTLVFFAHPHCPCTRASAEELNRLMAKCNGKVAAHVLFLSPANLSEDWTKTDLWKSVGAIPGVTVHADRDGAQARLFGAETSGQVVLFSPRGRLLFAGGITGGRGHAGDNAGENALASLLNGDKTRISQTPVYGCELFGHCEVPSGGTVQ